MDTEHFKQKLEAERATLEAELKTVGTPDPKNSEDWVPKEVDMDTMPAAADPNEAADKIEEYEENRAINDTLEVRHANVLHAIKKIGEGTYGTCEVGGEAIEEERLEANPAARTCKAHMDQEESLLA